MQALILHGSCEKNAHVVLILEIEWVDDEQASRAACTLNAAGGLNLMVV